MASVTEQRNKISADMMTRLTAMFDKEFGSGEVYFTGENITTLSFKVGEINGEPVYSSVKFTLHKSNWDLENEVNKYYEVLEERELKAKQKAQAKAEKDRKLAAQKEKAAKRAKAAKLEREKRQKFIAQLKEELGEETAED